MATSNLMSVSYEADGFSAFVAEKSAALREKILMTLPLMTSHAQIDKALQAASGELAHDRLTEADYSAICAAFYALRKLLKPAPTVAQRVPQLAQEWRENGQSRFKPHIRKRMPADKREEYMFRRRKLASSRYLPDELSGYFTTGQAATMAIIAQEIIKFGRCTLCIEKIAGLAGVSHATVRRALARAAEKGIVAIKYRPRRGAISLTNIVTVTSAAWKAWLARRKSGPTLREVLKKHAEKPLSVLFSTFKKQKCNPTPTNIYIKGNRLNADYSISMKFSQNLSETLSPSRLTPP